MPTRPLIRRTLALTASAGLAGALAWLPAGPASAAVTAMFETQGGASTSSSCTLTSGDDNTTSAPVTFSNGTRSTSVSLNAVFTNTGDSTDTATMFGHYSSTMSIKKSGGDLAKVSMSGKGSVKVQAAKGSASACDPTAIIDGFAEMEFTESHPGWIYVNRNTVPKQGVAVAAVVDGATGNTVAFDIWQGGASSAVARGFVKPGTFGSELAVGLTAGNYPPIFLKSAPKSSVTLVFHRSGSAVSGTSGNGGKFVRFPGSVSCSHHKATLSWSSKAGQVARGSFSVNGRHKATVSGPHAGRHVVLRHLSSTADTTITADLSLKGGGHATASRLYVPCKG